MQSDTLITHKHGIAHLTQQCYFICCCAGQAGLMNSLLTLAKTFYRIIFVVDVLRTDEAREARPTKQAKQYQRNQLWYLASVRKQNPMAD